MWPCAQTSAARQKFGHGISKAAKAWLNAAADGQETAPPVMALVLLLKGIRL